MHSPSLSMQPVSLIAPISPTLPVKSVARPLLMKLSCITCSIYSITTCITHTICVNYTTSIYSSYTINITHITYITCITTTYTTYRTTSATTEILLLLHHYLCYLNILTTNITCSNILTTPIHIICEILTCPYSSYTINTTCFTYSTCITHTTCKTCSTTSTTEILPCILTCSSFTTNITCSNILLLLHHASISPIAHHL